MCTAAGIWWIGKTWVSHRFDRNLELAKAEWEGEIKQRVEEYLGDRSAQREYELEGRKRLYRSIGPLRFQLVLAARDAAKHIKIFGLGGHKYSLEYTNYYGRSTLFRLIRPLALVELIEREITYADFSIDRDAIDLLCFKRRAYSTLSGAGTILHHPNADWDYQSQHVFFHSLNTIANSVLVSDEESEPRPLLFHEFEEFLEKEENVDKLHPLPGILGNFDINNTPLFWTRLICYGYLCASLVNIHGVKIGFDKIEFPHKKFISEIRDDFLRERSEDVLKSHIKILEKGL